MIKSARPRRALLAITALIVALIWFGPLDYRKLIKTDEGRYAEIAREMVASGDWLTPRSNDFKYFYKPPLQYWATATAFTVFGVNEWTARLWTAITGFLAILVTFATTRRLWNSEIAWTASAVLAGSLMWVALGHLATLDMGLASFVAIAIAALACAQRDDASIQSRRRWMLVAWASAALAVMSKGLIGVVLPAGGIGLYLVWSRDWRLIARLEWLSGGALFLLITAPWFIAVSMANPEFARFFFIHEHFERFLTKVHGRYEPPWYFIPILLAGLAPWTLALLHAVRAGWRVDQTVRFQPQRLLLAWIIAVLVFFSASSSKLPSYILPIFPAFAVLIALGIRAATARLRTAIWGSLALLGALLMASVPVINSAPRSDIPPALMASYGPWLMAAGVILIAGAIVAWWLDRSRGALTAVLAASLSALAAGQTAISGHERLSPVYSAYHVAEKLRPLLAPTTEVFAVDTYDHALPFYLGRTLTMVAYKDELAQAIAWEPEKFLVDYSAFTRAWLSAPSAAALMSPNEFKTFTDAGLPMRIVAQDVRRVIVMRP